MENIAVNNVLITIHLTSVSFNDFIFVNRYAPANTALLWTFPCISPLLQPSRRWYGCNKRRWSWFFYCNVFNFQSKEFIFFSYVAEIPSFDLKQDWPRNSQ